MSARMHQILLSTYGIGGNDSFTKLLLHSDGADAGTTFIDSSASANTMTAVGNAQIDTAQSVFGGCSMLLDGTGDRVTTPDSASWNFGAGDFTVDLRVRWRTTPTGVQTMIAQYDSSGANQRSWQIYWGSSNLNFLYSTNGTGSIGPITFSWSPSSATWYHVAISRSGNNLRAFIDGTQIGTTQTLSSTLFNSTAVLTIGDNSGGGTQPWDGWLDEIRVSTGTARWTANFTPPAGPYSFSSG